MLTVCLFDGDMCISISDIRLHFDSYRYPSFS